MPPICIAQSSPAECKKQRGRDLPESNCPDQVRPASAWPSHACTCWTHTCTHTHASWLPPPWAPSTHLPTRFSSVQFRSVRLGSARFGSAGLGPARPGPARLGRARLRSAPLHKRKRRRDQLASQSPRGRRAGPWVASGSPVLVARGTRLSQVLRLLETAREVLIRNTHPSFVDRDRKEFCC